MDEHDKRKRFTVALCVSLVIHLGLAALAGASLPEQRKAAVVRIEVDLAITSPVPRPPAEREQTKEKLAEEKETVKKPSPPMPPKRPPVFKKDRKSWLRETPLSSPARTLAPDPRRSSPARNKAASRSSGYRAPAAGPVDSADESFDIDGAYESPSARPSAQDLNDYKRTVMSMIDRAKRYPRGSEERGEQGSVTVEFVIEADGSVSGVGISGGSGFGRLDQAAADAVTSAAPFPPLPDGMGRQSLAVTAPIRFSLR